jgi:hypothetical protein
MVFKVQGKPALMGACYVAIADTLRTTGKCLLFEAIVSFDIRQPVRLSLFLNHTGKPLFLFVDVNVECRILKLMESLEDSGDIIRPRGAQQFVDVLGAASRICQRNVIADSVVQPWLQVMH